MSMPSTSNQSGVAGTDPAGDDNLGPTDSDQVKVFAEISDENDEMMDKYAGQTLSEDKNELLFHSASAKGDQRDIKGAQRGLKNGKPSTSTAFSKTSSGGTPQHPSHSTGGAAAASTSGGAAAQNLDAQQRAAAAAAAGFHAAAAASNPFMFWPYGAGGLVGQNYSLPGVNAQQAAAAVLMQHQQQQQQQTAAALAAAAVSARTTPNFAANAAMSFEALKAAVQGSPNYLISPFYGMVAAGMSPTFDYNQALLASYAASRMALGAPSLVLPTATSANATTASTSNGLGTQPGGDTSGQRREEAPSPAGSRPPSRADLSPIASPETGRPIGPTSQILGAPPAAQGGPPASGAPPTASSMYHAFAQQQLAAAVAANMRPSGGNSFNPLASMAQLRLPPAASVAQVASAIGGRPTANDHHGGDHRRVGQGGAHAHLQQGVGRPRGGRPLSQQHESRRDQHQRRSHKKPSTHIKKPLNAFMIYMKENRAKLMQERGYKERQSAELNKELGRLWHTLTQEEQQSYYAKARLERQKHMELHPGWSARDNYAIHKKKKRKRDRSDENNEAKKCRARFGLERQDKWCKHCKRKKRCLWFKEDFPPGSVGGAGGGTSSSATGGGMFSSASEHSPPQVSSTTGAHGNSSPDPYAAMLHHSGANGSMSAYYANANRMAPHFMASMPGANLNGQSPASVQHLPPSMNNGARRQFQMNCGNGEVGSSTGSNSGHLIGSPASTKHSVKSDASSSTHPADSSHPLKSGARQNSATPRGHPDYDADQEDYDIDDDNIDDNDNDNLSCMSSEDDFGEHLDTTVDNDVTVTNADGLGDVSAASMCSAPAAVQPVPFSPLNPTRSKAHHMSTNPLNRHKLHQRPVTPDSNLGDSQVSALALTVGKAEPTLGRSPRGLVGFGVGGVGLPQCASTPR